jgi:hypothetical protein
MNDVRHVLALQHCAEPPAIREIVADLRGGASNRIESDRPVPGSRELPHHNTADETARTGDQCDG